MFVPLFRSQIWTHSPLFFPFSIPAKKQPVFKESSCRTKKLFPDEFECVDLTWINQTAFICHLCINLFSCIQIYIERHKYVFFRLVFSMFLISKNSLLLKRKQTICGWLTLDFSAKNYSILEVMRFLVIVMFLKDSLSVFRLLFLHYAISDPKCKNQKR